MKLGRKIISLLLVAVMMLTVCGSAMAEDVTITINRDTSYGQDAEGNREYTYYQVFRASMTATHNTTGGGVETDGDPKDVTTSPANGVSYYLNTTTDSDVIAKFKAQDQLWFTLTSSADGSQQVVSWKESVTTDAETVQAAANWIVTNNAFISTGSLTAADDGESWSANVPQGYYVIAGSEGKNLVAATTNIAITEKNSYPTIDKKEQDEDKSQFVDDSVNIAVGDTIEYKVVVHIPGDANQAIAVIDKMTEGLTYDNNTGLTVQVDNADVTWTELVQGNDDEFDADADWQIKLSADTVKANANKDVVITFKATVNSNALTDTTRNNTVTLKYNNEHYVQNDQVEYTTHFTGIEKVDGTNHDTKLEGVKFTLTEKQGNNAAVAFNVTPVTEEGSDVVLYYIPGGNSNEVVTDKDGKIIIRGLDADKTYTLTETETLDGYNLLDQPKELSLVEDKGQAYTTATFDQIENNTGSILPSTGGMGTTILYVVGGLLVIAAAVLLMTKKRVGADK